MPLDALDHLERDNDLAPNMAELAGRYDDPADVAALNVDLAAFLLRLPDSRKSMIVDMILGQDNQTLSRKYAVSQGAISQWRRRFWELLDDYLLM